MEKGCREGSKFFTVSDHGDLPWAGELVQAVESRVGCDLDSRCPLGCSFRAPVTSVRRAEVVF